MVSKSVAIALALFTAANAAPALQARQADPCQDAYKSCVAAGTPEVACGCTLAACVGQDNARNREFCSSATASLTKASATTAAATSYACNPAHSYPNGAKCISTAGALSLVTPAPSASSTGYACNPAHSYPNGATCISTNGSLTFLNPAASTAAPAATSYACNPAHSYPNGAKCISTAGSLTLVTPAASTAAPAATSFACNPAHSYPNGAKCISTAGALSLVTPAPSASSTGYACNPAHSYPNGATCISTNGALTFLNPAASTAAPAPAKTSAVASAAASAATAAKVAAPGSNPVKVDGKTWSISDMTRYCGEDKTGCDYNFAINANGKTERCTIIRTPGSNAATESWSNQNCTTGSNFKVSWGFVEQPAPAYAVVTVVNGKELAWFGVSNINGQAVTPSNPFGSGQYGNLPAQQVYTYN